MKHQGFLEYRGYRYLKLAVWLCVFAVVAYGWHRVEHFHLPGGVGYGGTWMGYALGTVAALMVLWLLWLGIRKRRYRNSRTSLQGWVSAHVYFGLASVVVATLHSGFELGLNLHTLAYLLLVVVVFSGIYGVLVYVGEPTSMTGNMGEDSVETLLMQVHSGDQEAQRMVLRMPDAYVQLVQDAALHTRLEGSLLQHILRSHARRCPTTHAVQRMEVLNRGLQGEPLRDARALYGLMLARRSAVKKIRREFRSIARMRLWLMVHVPLSIALLCALVAHVVSVFIYW